MTGKIVTGILAKANVKRSDHNILTEDTCRQMAQQLNDKFPGCVSYNEETKEVIWNGPANLLNEWDNKHLEIPEWSIKVRRGGSK